MIGSCSRYHVPHRLLRGSPLFPSPSIHKSRLRLPYSPSHSTLSAYSVSSGYFTWDDVFGSEPLRNDSSDLRGFFDKVDLCNRNLERQRDFMPFVIEGQIVGYVHNEFSNHLRRHKDVFTFPQDSLHDFGYHISLHPQLNGPDERTKAVGDVIKSFDENLIPGIRNELYPVISSFGTQEYFSLERAAAPYFGIKAYGIQMNGYVERDGEKYLWVAKRSKSKSTYPGKLDHLVAGGLPHGISCEENVIKECEEEAGIPRSISSLATAVGAVSYMDINGFRFKRDVLFCYDLKLPEDFVPKNEDGEVESFKLIPITHVADIIRRTQLFKDNCNLVIIDFLFRHGYIKPESLGYLKLLQGLRSGDCT